MNVTHQQRAERLAAVINNIIQQPTRWKQEEYHCGSAHCFAGHADILAGYWDWERCTFTNEFIQWVAEQKAAGVDMRRLNTCSGRATYYLGITSKEALWLFAAYRTFAELYSFVIWRARSTDAEFTEQVGRAITTLASAYPDPYAAAAFKPLSPAGEPA